MTASTDEPPGRDAMLEDVFNLRDLGGYRAIDGRRVRWRRVYRGAGLYRLSGADLRRVRGLEWATVVDLRTDREVQATGICPAVAARGPVLHRPMIRETWNRGLLDQAQPADEFLCDRYRDMLSEGAPGAPATTMLAQPEPFMQAPAAAMRLLLAWLTETHGGADGYLRSIGVAPARITALRDRLLEPVPA